MGDRTHHGVSGCIICIFPARSLTSSVLPPRQRASDDHISIHPFAAVQRCFRHCLIIMAQATDACGSTLLCLVGRSPQTQRSQPLGLLLLPPQPRQPTPEEPPDPLPYPAQRRLHIRQLRACWSTRPGRSARPSTRRTPLLRSAQCLGLFALFQTLRDLGSYAVVRLEEGGGTRSEGGGEGLARGRELLL